MSHTFMAHRIYNARSVDFILVIVMLFMQPLWSVHTAYCNLINVAILHLLWSPQTDRPTLSLFLFHSADIPKNLTANKFNNHFLSVAEFLAKSRSDVEYHSDCSNILHEFCERKTWGQEPFVIPYISIPELGKHISKMDDKIWTRWHS